MVGLTIEVRGLDEAVKAFERADAIIQHEFRLAMDQSVKVISGAAKKGAPVGVSGELRASISDEIINVGAHDVEGRVGSPLPYAIYVEMGTAPHYPPIAPLLLWVQRKLQVDQDNVYGVAKAIQRKIGRSGTKANPFFQKAFEENKGRIETFFERALERIAQRLATE